MADNDINVRLVAQDAGFTAAVNEAKNVLAGFAPAATSAGEAAREAGEALKASGESATKAGEAASKAKEPVSALGEAFERLKSIGESLGEFELLYRGFELLKEGFESVTTGATEWGEKIVNLSAETGVSIGHLQQFQFAAQATGQEMDRLVQFTTRLSRAVLELSSSSSSGGGRLSDVLAAAGLKPADLNDSYTAILKIGDAINRLGEGSTAARALLSELGGRGAAQLEPAIAKFREFADEANRMGLILQDQLVRQLADTQEQFNVLGAVISADEHLIGAALTPAMTVLANLLTEVTLKINEWARSGELQVWLNVVTDDVIDFGAKAVDAIEVILPLVKELAELVKDVADNLARWVTPAGLESQFKEFYDNIKAIGDNLYGLIPGFSAASTETNAFKDQLSGVGAAANSAGASVESSADKAAAALKRQVDASFAAQKAALAGAATPSAEGGGGAGIPHTLTPAETAAIAAAQAKLSETIIKQQAATATARLAIEKGFVTDAEALGEIYKSTAIRQLEDIANRDYEIKRTEVDRSYAAQIQGIQAGINAEGARSAKGQELSAQLQSIEVDRTEKLKQLEAEHVATVQKSAADITVAIRKENAERIKIEQEAAKQYEAIEKARVEATLTTSQAAIRYQQAQAKASDVTEIAPKFDLSGLEEDMRLSEQLAQLPVQRAAAEQAADQQTYNSQRALLASQLAGIAQQGPAYDELTAKKNALDREWAATSISDSAKVATAQTDAATASLDAWRSAFTSMQTSIVSAVDVFTGPLNSAIDGLITGTETIATAFRKMAVSIIEDLIRIAIETAVLKAANLATGAVLGAAPVAGAGAAAGGGLGGAAGAAGVVPQTAATTLNTTAITANTTAIAANTAALAGHAAAGGASAVTGGATVAATSAQTAAITTQTSILTLIETTLVTMASTLVTIGTELLGQAALLTGINTQLIAVNASLVLLNAKPSAFGFSYQHGGMVPGSGPIPALLHGGERVLSVDEVRHGIRPHITQAPTTTEASGGEIHQHFNITPVDQRGFEKYLKANKGVFEKLVRDNLRGY